MGQKIKRIIKDNKICKLLFLMYESILEIIYPAENYCIICGKEDCDRICDECLRSISIINNSNEFIESYGHYGGVLKKLILKFKFYGDFTAGEILSELLIKYIKENYDYKKYIITYIPITKKAERKRGFNQCEYIALKISRNFV